MIEAESNAAPSNAVIRWSGSGRAFHIDDTQVFSSEILPKYFRTNKFSSFQRNLNLVSACTEVMATEAEPREELSRGAVRTGYLPQNAIFVTLFFILKILTHFICH